MNKLHVDSILKSFGTEQILTDIYLSCTSGEIIGLLGRNSSGKSTLLKIIFGSLNAENKYIKINEKIIHRFNQSQNIIKYLPQDNFIPGNIKNKQIIKLLCNKNGRQILFNHELIKPLLNKRYRYLSGGEKRLVEIFAMINSDSKFLLLDEPFNGIAPIHKEAVKEMLKKHTKTKGMIITDHDYRNIIDVASKLVLLHDGGLKDIKTKDDLKYWGYLTETA